MSLYLYTDKMIREEMREQRVKDEAQWYIDNKTSVRDVAKNFMVSKSTVWLDFTERLKYIDMELYDQVKTILRYNGQHAVEKMNKANAIRRYRR